MILNPGNKIAIDLGAWHYWLPVWPIKITTRDSRGNGEIGVWRWMYVVQRKNTYGSYTGQLLITSYRDLIR